MYFSIKFCTEISLTSFYRFKWYLKHLHPVSFLWFLFFRKLLYNFCFLLDVFRPLVIHGLLRFLSSEAATGGVLKERVFLEISQNSQENTCARVSFLIRLWHRYLSVNFAKFQNTFFTEHLWATASVSLIFFFCAVKAKS